MAVEKGRATKAVPKPKVKAQAQRKPTPVAAPLTTGDKAVDAILARIQQMAGPAASINSDPGLPADYNAKGGDAERKKLLSQPDGGFKLNGPKGSDFHKLLDIIMRPGQALRTGIRYENEQDNGAFSVNPGAFAKGAAAGFTGKDVTTGKQVNRREKGFGAGTAGFLTEVILDPINLIPGAGLGRALNKVDDTVLGAAKITTPAAKKRAANKAADAAASAAPAAAANTAEAVRFTDTPSPALTPIGLPDEILERETRLAKRAGSIQPKTAGDDLFGVGEMKATLPTVKPIPKPVQIPVATAKTMPPPATITLKDLSKDVQKEIFETAQTKVGAIFDADPLSSKLSSKFNGPYGARLTWEQVSSNQEILKLVRGTPGFRELWGKVLNDEANDRLAALNAEQTAEYVKSVKAIEAAAAKAAPEAVAQLDEITPQVLPGGKAVAPKPLSEIHLKAVSEAAELHTRTNGDRALTALGQGKLLQTVVHKYFTAVPGAANRKLTPNVRKKIRQLYTEAEKSLVDRGIPLQARGLLSENWDRIPKEALSDPSKIAKFLEADDVVSAAKEIASDLPVGVQASFVKKLLDGFKASGNSLDVTTQKYMGTPELRFRAAEAVAEDMGLTLPRGNPELFLKSSAEYQSVLAFFGRYGEALDRAMRTAYGKTPWEQGAIRMGEGAVNTRIEKDVHHLRKMFLKSNRPTSDAAFKIAQNGGDGEFAEEIIQFQTHLKDMMALAGVTENEWIQRLRTIPGFTDAKGSPKFDIGEGFDAWKTLQFDRHPAQAMALMANAAHNATLTSVVGGQLGKTLGAVKRVGKNDPTYDLAKKKGYVKVKGVPDTLFPKDYAPRIEELLSLVGPQGHKKVGEFMKVYDKGLSLYKVGLTKYLPSHHITNHIGGRYLAWLDGMTSLKWDKAAIDVMRQQDAAATGLLDAPITGTLKLASDKGELSYPEVMKLFNDSGLRPSFAGISDLASDQAELKIKNKVATAVDKASQAREVQLRLAHFMYALSVEKGAFNDAVQAAAMRVQKHHGDYGDLTDFERRVMRRVIPFYTWQRKVVPTLLRQAASHPGKIMVYPKLQQSINSHFGIDPEPGNPFPGGELTPSFMTEGIQAKYGSRDNGNEIWGGFRTPFEDVVGKAVNHPVGNILEMLTPAIRVPYELNSGTAIGNPDIRVLYENEENPIAGKDKRDYVEQNTPMLSLLVRLLNKSPLHGFESNKVNEDEQGTNIPALINLLTGANLRENTQRMQTIAERERASQANG